MKKFSICCVFIICFVIIFGGCANTTGKEGKLLRIHIRANSDLTVDQEVKMKVVSAISDLMSGKFDRCSDIESAKSVAKSNISAMQNAADRVLGMNSVAYKSKVSVSREYFPTRCYGDIVVEAGCYDAIIVELGEAKGDNWWCVVYPSLCFLGAEYDAGGFRYKSIIAERWRKFISSL